MPFDRELPRRGCLWLKDLSEEEKYQALAQIHEFVGWHEPNNPDTYRQRHDGDFDSMTCVFWSDISESYCLQNYSESYFPKRASAGDSQIVKWLSQPTRVVDFNALR